MKTYCINCASFNIQEVDTTHSNINTSRAVIGQLTGIISQCQDCNCLQIENLLTNQTEPFNY